MKKTLLTTICFFIAFGVNAVNYTGTNITLTEETAGAEKIQKVVTTEAGAFSAFMQSDESADFGAEGAGTAKICMISGPMNSADFSALSWGGFEIIDFTNVTMAEGVTFTAPSNYQNGKANLIILPKTMEPTNAQLESWGDAWGVNKPRYAYYKDQNAKVICLTSVNFAQKRGIDPLLDKLDKLVDNNKIEAQGLAVTYTPDSNSETGFNYYLPIYQNENKADLINKLGHFEYLDLRGFNISDLGSNFTSLADTKFLVLPANATSDTYDASTDIAQFTYSQKMEIVAAIVDNDNTTPFGNRLNFSGENVSAVADPSVNSITAVASFKAGGFPDFLSCMPSEMANTEKFLMAGQLGASDITAINTNVKCSFFDLDSAIPTADANITSFNNAYAKWLAVPNNTRPEQIDAIYATLSGNTDFHGVAGFTTQALAADGTNGAVLANTLITYTAQQGSVYNLVYMLDKAHNGHNNDIAGLVKNVIMSGQLNAFDICNSVDEGGATMTPVGSASVDVAYKMAMASDGHLYITSITNKGGNKTFASQSLPNGLTQINAGALKGANLNSIDFTKAIFDQPSTTVFNNLPCPGYLSYEQKLGLVTDMNFVALNIIPAELKLPTDASQKVIPPFFLGQTGGTDGSDKKVVSSLCLPSNFQYIMDGAFNQCEVGLYHIYTTAPNPEPAGFIDTEVDHGVEWNTDGTPYKSTYTLASTLKYIGQAAFDTQDANAMADVYVLAQVAPTCEPYAFNSSKLVGNNGFYNSHPICRDNYRNAGWIAVLHFPNAIGNEAKKYTDTEREYWYVDETGAVDGEGNLLRWPCHSEFLRSYNQAGLGYIWTDPEWSQERVLVEDDGRYGQILAYGGNNYATLNNIVQIVENGEVTGTKEIPNKATDCDSDCGFKNTVGWHQFLLASPGYFYEVESKNYVETPWYTFCIPFDMTLQELNKYLGVPANATSNAGAQPDVRTLRAVERNTTSRHTDIVISKNLIAEGKDIETYGATDNKYQLAQYVDITTQKDGIDVYLKGGYPYFVKGWVPEGTDLSKYNNNLGQYVLAIAQFDTEDLGNVIIIDPSATAVSDDNIVNTKHYEAGDRNFIAMPYFNHTVDAKSIVDNCFYGERTNLPTGIDEDVPYLYNFMGNYEPEDFATTEAKEMPQYSYYMASGKIYRYKTKKSGYLWKPYICMIGLNGEGTVYQKVISQVMTYHSAYDKVADDNKWGINEFAQEGDESSVGTFSIVFDEDDVPGGDVDKIINLNGQEMDVKVSAIYNLNGQYVGNSLNSLAKGVYVVNGKKIVVK